MDADAECLQKDTQWHLQLDLQHAVQACRFILSVSICWSITKMCYSVLWGLQSQGLTEKQNNKETGEDKSPNAQKQT
jgi:hypothetical protein